jgi:hypothetical protein
MNDAIQDLALCWVGKDQFAQTYPVESAVSLYYFVAESCHHRCQSRRTGCDNGPGRLVGIHDMRAQPGKRAGHKRFTNSYRTRKTD